MNSGFKDIFIGYGHLNFGSAYEKLLKKVEKRFEKGKILFFSAVFEKNPIK